MFELIAAAIIIARLNDIRKSMPTSEEAEIARIDEKIRSLEQRRKSIEASNETRRRQ